MRCSTLRKWLYLIGMSGFLLQATVGCPNGAMLRGVGSTALQALFNGIIGLYIKAGANQAFNV
jgi:hypothetical protein